MFHVVATGNEVIYISLSVALSPLAHPKIRYFEFGLNNAFLWYLQTLNLFAHSFLIIKTPDTQHSNFCVQTYFEGSNFFVKTGNKQM